MHESESESEVAQSCPTLIDPMNCSLPGSSVHGIFQARVLEWGAIAFSKKNVYLWPIHVYVWQKPTQYCKILGQWSCFSVGMYMSGEGNGTPLQYSCLENPMGRGAW